MIIPSNLFLWFWITGFLGFVVFWFFFSFLTKKEYKSKMLFNFCHFHFSVDWANLVFQKVDFFHRKWLLSFISYITFIVLQSVLFQSICIVSFLRSLNFNVILFSCFSYFLWELHCSCRKFRKNKLPIFMIFFQLSYLERQKWLFGT